jgi:multicomponent Na+:H+ antiporter subunit G
MIDGWSLREVLSLGPIILGTFFALVAALGILRMPDLLLRMSMTTKAATLGVGSMLVAAIIHFDELGIATRGMAIIIFLLLTAPVSAQMIGRAGYLDEESILYPKTYPDELANQYDLKENTLASRE